MDWLPQPFSQLSGPAFLLVYGAFAAAVIIVSRLQVMAADRSLASPLPPVSPERDPYEIAYLRGGGNELLRFTIFDAMRRDVLELVPPAQGKKTQRIQKKSALTKAETGSEIFDNIVNWCIFPRTNDELFASPFPKAIEAWGAKDFGPSLEADGLLNGAAVRSAATRVRLYGSAALVIFAGLRLLEAFSLHHRNIGFLLLMLFVSLVLLFALTKVPRLSRRGRAYLQRLQAALRPAGAAPGVAGGAGAAGAALLPIFVAATGLQALAGTEFAPIDKLFPARVSSGGDSGGCGSSGGSSSSCGGGGGCGGGGCGG
jgi:uncharacterized protein (TIGR04222 family)